MIVDSKKFKAMLMLLIPNVIEQIIKEYQVSEIEAINMLYSSQLYTALENEETKLWHFSPKLLFTLFDEEIKTGTINYPEE